MSSVGGPRYTSFPDLGVIRAFVLVFVLGPFLREEDLGPFFLREEALGPFLGGDGLIFGEVRV